MNPASAPELHRAFRLLGLIGLVLVLAACGKDEERSRGCPSGQTEDRNGICRPDCRLADLRCLQGHCEEVSGSLVCVCEPGHTGEACDSCADGYQDNDGDGVCHPDCETAALSCGKGVCGDADGTAACRCDVGYGGEGCSSCAPGYQDYGREGICRQDCTSSDLSCGAGRCVDGSGVAQCVCPPGYEGASCERCADGYQDNDADGICKKDCESSGLGCLNGSCVDASGEALCLCETGYAGLDCGRCDSGYQDNDLDGVCLADCSTAALGCEFGVCDDSDGGAKCICDEGFGGDRCTGCAPGHVAVGERCVPDCEMSGFSCVHGVCDYSTGAAACLCEEGYGDFDCRGCAAGYQDHDGDGICLPGCGLVASCDDGLLCHEQTGVTKCIPYPATCLDVRIADPRAGDNPYDLYLDRDATRVWRAICRDMAGEPKEYVATRRNYSQYALTPEQWMETVFIAFRFDPQTLRVKIDDFQYASTVGHGLSGHVPFGTAISCDGEDVFTNVSFVNTPFRMAGTTFCLVGPNARGTTTFSDDHREVRLTGAGSVGDCSGLVPSLDPTCGAARDPDGWDIQLEYSP